MDALSKIFDDIHLHQSEYLYLKGQGNWAFHYQQTGTIVAYVVLSGELHLRLEHSSDKPTYVCVKAGDIVLIPDLSHQGSNQKDRHLSQQMDIAVQFGHAQTPVILGTAPIHEDSNPEQLILTIRCHVDAIMAKPLLKALPEYMHIHHMIGNHTPEWLQIGLQFLALESMHIRPGRDKILDHLVSILLIECVRDYIAQLDDSHNWLNALTHAELSNALAVIHGQPERLWTVESLAEQCCMSRSKFANLFTQVLGESPLAYLQQHRLRLAAQHLRHGQLSIQQIAHRVGYSSETAFSQTFKKSFELTPTQYRNQRQNSD